MLNTPTALWLTGSVCFAPAENFPSPVAYPATATHGNTLATKVEHLPRVTVMPA